MELWTAFILGLAGSAHCAGMCGPLVLALPAGAATSGSHVLGRIAYNGGRLATYCGLGVVFGLIGRSLALAGVQRWVSIAVGLALLLGLALSRSRFLNWPVAGTVGWLKSALGWTLRRRTGISMALLGSLNGLLPCGLVYVACAGAAATGSVLRGAEYMLAFGLGTVPMMLGLAIAGTALRAPLRLKLQKLIPVTVGLVAVLLILRGLGLGIPYLSPDLAAPRSSCCH